MKKLNARFNDSIKRILDITGAAVGLILSSGLFIIFPILIKLDSSGPAFYTQTRIGRDRRVKERRKCSSEMIMNRRNGDRRGNNHYGKPFKIYKFRTMREDAEKKCGPVWASDNDPRITTVGRILRSFNLDELPQLINILKGDMSFVGPRPERPFFINQLAYKIPGYAERQKAKPGLTGLAQLKTDDDASLDNAKTKLMFDLQYCQNKNLGSYFKIISLTLARSFSGSIKI